MKRSRLQNCWRGLIAMFFIAMQGSFASFSIAPRSAWAADSSGSFTISIRLRDIWPPEPIADLNAVPGAEGQLLLEWTAPSEDSQIAVPSLDPVAAYDLRYATFSVDSLGGDTTAWFDGAIEAFGEPSTPAARGVWQGFTVDLEPGVTYYFAIKSVDDGGNISPIDVKAAAAGQQAWIRIPDNVPAAPGNLAAVAGPEGIALSWDAVNAPDLASYKLYVDSTVPYDFADSYSIRIDSNVTSYLHPNLAFGTTYTYRIAAVDKGAPEFLGQALESATSNIASAMFNQEGVRPLVLEITIPSVYKSPEGEYYGVPASTPTFLVKFSERILESTLNQGIRLVVIQDNTGKIIDSTAPVTISFSTATLTAEIRPSTALAKGYFYDLDVTTSVTDLAGNAVETAVTTRFQTEIDVTVENVLMIDENTFIRVPPGLLSEGETLAANTNVLEDPVTVEVADLLTANQKLAENTDGAIRALEETFIELYTVNAAGTVQAAKVFPIGMRPAGEGAFGEVIMVVGYSDKDQDGFVDGIYPKVKEKDLSVFTLKENEQRWVRVLGTSVEAADNKLIAPIRKLGIYSLVSTLDTFLGNAHAYPVPFRAVLGHTHITFTDLSSRATIRIYTVTGKLVKTLYESDGDGELKWDAHNEEGESVASGVYLFIIESATEKKIGKLIIIR